jgi:peptide deformylase
VSLTDWTPRLRIEQTGSPILHRAAEPVAPEFIASAEVQQLIDMMIAALDSVGVGLAAPQVRAGLRIAIIGDPPELQASVPPELLRSRNGSRSRRMCLSIRRSSRLMTSWSSISRVASVSMGIEQSCRAGSASRFR